MAIATFLFCYLTMVVAVENTNLAGFLENKMVGSGKIIWVETKCDGNEEECFVI